LAESQVVQPLAPVCSTGSSTIEPGWKAAWPAMETGSSMRRTIKPTLSQASKMRLQDQENVWNCKGKKIKNALGEPTFEVHKMTKDLGQCTATTAAQR
jgi:hypothetical protein